MPPTRTTPACNFKLQHLGLSFYTLKFRTYDATVSFDPANIAASKVTATIKPTDILAGYPSDYVANHQGTKFKTWEDDLANSAPTSSMPGNSRPSPSSRPRSRLAASVPRKSPATSP